MYIILANVYFPKEKIYLLGGVKVMVIRRALQYIEK
jgi:hypothetical protein